ncbi:MAG: hypothetical protein EG824_02475 [Deltaproteobacteria bacterium]|nr:hypothetical protein [Deltaproteobacteria bacterium]TLN01777.1 MAG: hypothetical protein FDZ73_14355 [bacterium]
MKIQEFLLSGNFSRTAKLIFWLISTIGLTLSVMSVLQVCVSACSDVSLYTIFGVEFGWFGILFFATLLTLLILQSRSIWAGKLFVLLVYSAAGAELQFIRLQKYVIGSWCPLCLVIASGVFLALIFVLWENWRTLRLERAKMKTFLKHAAVIVFTVFLGLAGAIVGVKGQSEAQELNLFLGKTDSSTVIYFVSDWFCPACRRTEPAIEKMYPKIAEIAKVSFIDIPVHPETSNFTPYNLQFLVYEKAKYMQLRKALSELSEKTKTPSPEDVQAAVAPYGVKLRSMNFTDILSGMKWNETTYKTFEVKATPTVVVSNTKTGKHVNLVGENEIRYEAILKGITKVGK